MVMIPDAMEFILKQKDGRERFIKNVVELTKIFALAVPSDEALEIKDEVGFFQAIKSVIIKSTATKSIELTEGLDSAINQLISKAIISDRVIDIFAAAGLKKPNISLLSDEFLAEVKDLPQKNLAFEMLKKLLNDEIKIKMKKNLVQGRSFMDMLDKTIKSYVNKSVETAQLVAELVELAKNMREANKRGEQLNLTDDEIAFYDALADNGSAVKILGDETLKKIARELVETVHRNVTIDWTLRENVQAKLRVMIKKILKKYHYPPDKQQKATETVLEQAHLIGKDWAEIMPA